MHQQGASLTIPYDKEKGDALQCEKYRQTPVGMINVFSKNPISEFVLIRMFKGAIPAKKIFISISFYAIMHRTIIVQNKIISIICSCLFFVRLIFIGLV